MAYSLEVIRRARARLAEAKSQKEAEYQEHLRQAYARYPRLQQIDRELRQTMAAVAAASFASGKDAAKTVAEAKEKNLRLQNERQWILDAGDMEEGFLDDTPVCAACGGSGYVGAQMCSCLKELCRQEQKRALAPLFVTGRESFEQLTLRYYSDLYDPSLGTSPRQMMQLNVSVAKRFAATFSLGAESLLFIGATGLGKTFLSACIARQVTDSGFSVTYETAGKLFDAYEAVRFGRGKEGQTREYTQADLLVVDDLGTEMTNQFVVAALYQLVNDRLLSRRPTIISTNLRPEELERRYGPQTASRLLGAYRLVAFAGEDIRPKLRQGQ